MNGCGGKWALHCLQSVLGPFTPSTVTLAAGTYALFKLAEQEASSCIQLVQIRGRPDMALLPPGTSDLCLQRGRAAVARARECGRALKPWLPPHLLAREKAAARELRAELERAASAAPSRGERWCGRGLTLLPGELPWGVNTYCSPLALEPRCGGAPCALGRRRSVLLPLRRQGPAPAALRRVPRSGLLASGCGPERRRETAGLLLGGG